MYGKSKVKISEKTKWDCATGKVCHVRRSARFCSLPMSLNRYCSKPLLKIGQAYSNIGMMHVWWLININYSFSKTNTKRFFSHVNNTLSPTILAWLNLIQHSVIKAIKKCSIKWAVSTEFRRINIILIFMCGKLLHSESYPNKKRKSKHFYIPGKE